jgi:hypothetical protein
MYGEDGRRSLSRPQRTSSACAELFPARPGDGKAIEYAHRTPPYHVADHALACWGQNSTRRAGQRAFRQFETQSECAIVYIATVSGICSMHQIVPLDRARSDAESYGLFATERKARNALTRLATRQRLCHSLLA